MPCHAVLMSNPAQLSPLIIETKTKKKKKKETENKSIPRPPYRHHHYLVYIVTTGHQHTNTPTHTHTNTQITDKSQHWFRANYRPTRRHLVVSHAPFASAASSVAALG